MHRIAIACLICLIGAQPALAGAWLREKGTGFLAVSSTLRAVSPNPDYDSNIYADYGLTSRLTIGLDLHDKPGSGGHVMAFVRLPLPALFDQSHFAIELGLGAHYTPQDMSPMYRLGLSWGQGFDGRFGPGWIAVDSAIEYRSGTASPLLKLDAAIGLSSTRRVRPLLQLETSIGPDRPLEWALIPSAMISTKSPAVWVVGLQHRSFGKHRTGIKVAVWRPF